MQIRVMSFNIQHCLNYRTRQIDFDLFAQVIRQSRADIVGLNEVNGRGAGTDYLPQAEILAEKLGFHAYFAQAIAFDGVNPYGNALLSRYPIEAARTILIPDPETRGYDGYYETRCLLKAVVRTPQPLTVCVTHFGLNPDEQALAQKTVLAQIEDQRCILMGDFNTTPDAELLQSIRARMTDTAALLQGSVKTFPSDHPDRKLDYLFLSRDLTAQSAEILPIIASDHRPYSAPTIGCGLRRRPVCSTSS